MSKITLDELAVMIKKEFDSVHNRIDGLDGRMDSLDGRMDSLELSMQDLKDGQDEIKDQFNYFARQSEVDELTGRVTKLEVKAAS